MKIIDYLFVFYVVVCAVTDLTKNKIYNVATFPAVILGLGLNWMYFDFGGLKNSFLGILVGFAILYLFYLGGGVGAGDVKFLMGAGALKGYSFVFKGTLVGILFAGIVAIVYMFSKGILWKAFKNIFLSLFSSVTSGFKISPLPSTKSPALPFGFYLAVGILAYFFYEEVFLL